MLHHMLGAEATVKPARKHAQEVCRCIIDDVHGTRVTKRASQNLTAAAILLLAGPEPMTSEHKKLRQHLQMLLDTATE
jgi:hypothetical protein